MAKKVSSKQQFIGGIADYKKQPNSVGTYAWGRSIDVRTEPGRITLLPRTVKESGSVIVDLPLWGERIDSNSYFIGDTGHFYKRTSAASYSDLRTIANNHGNGLCYFGEDDYLYYPNDKVIGRYGPIGGTPAFADDFLGAEGGVPQNTNALDLEASSSQYAYVNDHADTSVTGDLALEIYYKPESLPTVGNSYTLISKWLEQGNQRSYLFDIYAVSGYFGDGSDGALTISSDTTEAPIDSAATGTINTQTVSATNASFAADQIILIHQSQGTGAGTWQRTKIISYTAGTITTADPLNATYGTGAQVRVLKQYTNVTINSGKVYSTKAWNGTVGGIIAFVANGTITATGTVSATGATGLQATSGNGGGRVAGGGYRGGPASWGRDNSYGSQGYQGEGPAGDGSKTSNANGVSGGGGTHNNSAVGNAGAGGGGGHAAGGSSGQGGAQGGPGTGGGTGGTADLTTMIFGGAGGGGGGGYNYSSDEGGAGGNGGGIIFLSGVDIIITGSLTSNGGNGGTSNTFADGSTGGGGAGGSILLKCQTATLGTNLITVAAGAGGLDSSGQTHTRIGGAGAVGRIHIDYYTSYTGTTSPTIDAVQDNTLVTNTTYQMRLSVSNDGTAVERLTKNVSIATGVARHLAVSWDASTSTATFLIDGVSQGTATGAFTAIYDSTAKYAVGAYFDGASAATAFADGIVDDSRLWNTERTASQILANKDRQLAGTEAGLKTYHRFNGDYTDTTAGAHTLTAVNTPVFTADVPFADPTTRRDLDQSLDTSGQLYTLTTGLNEGATHRQTFVPAKDPQKSLQVNIDTIGTGNWTLVVHDGLNRTIATATAANGVLNTGDYEFIFTTPWRPILGASYHFHLYSSVADGKVVTTNVGDLETADYHTYYQFLVTDTQFHPAIRHLNMVVIGNERYAAVWDAQSYDPHRLTFPAGYRVRALGYWLEYVAIGVQRGTNITDSDEGRIFFWDGYSKTYNFSIPVPQGGINAMFGTNGELNIFAGYQGDHLVYTGGVKAKKVKRMPKITRDKTIEILPGAVTMWQALLRYGAAGCGDTTVVERGVYTWGHNLDTEPDALTYDYPISTGTRTSSTVKIGMVLPLGNQLLIGWQDNTAFGIDVVDPTAAPYPDGTIELLIKDDDKVWKEKILHILRADMEPLNTGESINIKHKADRASDWTAMPAPEATALARKVRFPLKSLRHNELQVAVDLATSVSTSPALLEISIKDDSNEEELEL